MTCVNINDRDFQILQQKSGIPVSLLSAYVGGHLDRYGELPKLEDLPGANSEPYLKQVLKVKGNSVKLDQVLKYTGAKSLEEAIQYINKNHGDLQVQIYPINKEGIIKIQHKPSKYDDLEDIEEIEVNPNMNSVVALSNMVNKLFSLYGVQIQMVDNQQLEEMGISTIAKGLILDGNILINSDIATIDTPIHEMLHLLIGGLRFKHPTMYENLVKHSESFSNIEQLQELYPNRTYLDLLEESLVTELSKFMTNQPNEISQLDENIQKLISKDFCDILDYLLMGTKSTEILPNLAQQTLNSLAKVVQSRTFENKFKGTLDSAKLSRQVANLKEDLIKNNKLEEECL